MKFLLLIPMVAWMIWCFIVLPIFAEKAREWKPKRYFKRMVRVVYEVSVTDLEEGRK